MDTPLLITLIIVGSIVIIGVIVFVILFRKKKKNNYDNYRKKYEETHLLLTSECLNMVNRVSRLGKFNTYFEAVATERNKQYKALVERKDNDAEFTVKALEDALRCKDKKNLKELAQDCETSLEDFESNVCKFYEDLCNILQDDNEIHSASVGVKNKFRQVKEFYENSGDELIPLKESFVALLEDSQEKFVLFDKAADEADFDKAKQVLEDNEKILDMVLSIMDKLPYYEASVNTVLPNKLDKLNEEYEEMLNEDYCVEYMEIPAFVEQKKKRLVELGEQLRYLDVEGVEEEITSLQTQITDGFMAFDKERKAKENYLATSSSLSESSYGMEKRYSALILALPMMSETYLLDELYVSQIKELKGDIENIGILKRELDSYLDTSERKPYIVIEKTMNTMISEMEKAKVVMDDYDAYLELLRDNSAATYEENRQDYIRIKRCEFSIKELSLNSLIKKTSEDFTSLYNQILSIDSILTTFPVNVPKAVEEHEALQKQLTTFEEMVQEKKKAFYKAEAAICYANSYRVDFSDSKNKIDQAEKSFMEGDFDKAIQLSSAVISMYKDSLQNA